MAIQKTVSLKDQFGKDREFADAYIRIDTIDGDKSKLTLRVGVYEDASESKNLLQNKSFNFSPDLAGDNFIAQGYAHLKTLPEFADAIDC